MKKFDVVLFIVSFFRETRGSRNFDLGFKSPLVLHSDANNEMIIEKYYEYDVTISEYQNSKRIKIRQECYSDLPIAILEQIQDQIQLIKSTKIEQLV